MHRVWILVLLTFLAACSSQDDSPGAGPETSQSSEPDDANEPASTGATAPVEELSRQDLQALARDPEAIGGEIPRPGRRAQWWENDAVVRNLGLADAQTTRITEAHARMMAAARQSRRQLAQAAHDLQNALVNNDRESLEELVDSRLAALNARARAEADWFRHLLDILDDEQLRKLAQEHPELMSALLSPVR